MENELVVEIGFRTRIRPKDYKREDYVVDLPKIATMSNEEFICAAVKYDLEQGHVFIGDYSDDIGEGNIKVIVSV